MELEPSKLYDILIECLKKDKCKPETAAVTALSDQDWHNLLALAAMQRITPLLWHRIKQKNLETFVPEMAAAQLKEAYRRNTLRNLRFNGELRLLLTALNAENIPLILLKGMVLANTVYENIGLREMNDIDVLARPEHLTRIADILMGMGYKSFNLGAEHHLPRLIRKGHAGFEIHWNLINPNERYSIDLHGLWERAVPIQIVGCPTLTLSPEDMLLYLCQHTSYHHTFDMGLRPFCDIAEMSDRLGLAMDWQVVADRTHGQGWQRAVYLVLRLAVELAGAAVPVDILERLQPADMPETILETARAQIFGYKSCAIYIPPSLSQLLKNRRLSDKINIIWQRIFLPKATISAQYSIPMDSIKIYGCYPRRLYDLLRRHGHTLKKYRQNDATLKNLVERENLIETWLAQPAGVSENPEQRHNR